jgi:hypothetical protein
LLDPVPTRHRAFPVCRSGKLLRCIETGKPSVFVKIFTQMKIRFNSWSAIGIRFARTVLRGIAIDALVHQASHG